ncbi:arginine--tRNA ligase [Candidatus Altiarchaeota archaeon]
MADIQKKNEDYGSGEKKKEKLVLEHTSVNPSGPIHVGRIRNTLLGDSLRRILTFSGFEVETHYYVNDVGKQIAIIAQGKQEKIPLKEDILSPYPNYKEKKDFTTLATYVSSNSLFEEDNSFQEKVQSLIQGAESGNKESLCLLKETASECLEGQKEIFDRLDVRFDSFDFESKYIENESARKIVERLRKTKYAKEIEGGFGLDLSDYGIEKRGGATILQRADGTTVYTARDLAYHLDKGGQGDRLINVLGEDHKLQFQELNTILTEFLDYKTPLEPVHYSFVTFEGTKLSTRKGQTAPVDVLLDEAEEKAKTEIEKRKIASPDLAPDIGHGAVKYHILKTNPNKNITFRWEDALSFEGEAAPYIQYMHARSCRILEKAEEDPTKIKVDEIDTKLDGEEKELLKSLAAFPEVSEKSAAQLRPDIMANYLYQLASNYSRFYKECRVLEEQEKVRDRRLLLVDCARIIIETGLSLLGIKAPNRM